MKVKETFIAFDGTEFNTRTGCAKYEDSFKEDILENLNHLKVTNKLKLFDKEGNELDICDLHSYSKSYYIYIEDEETREKAFSLICNEDNYYSFYYATEQRTIRNLFEALAPVSIPTIFVSDIENLDHTVHLPLKYTDLNGGKAWYESEKQAYQDIINEYEKNIKVINKLQKFLKERIRDKLNEEI